MTRWKAAGLHLCIGLVVLTAIVGSMLVFWYPHKLYRIAGLDQLLITMLCVDLVVGPLLTCVVYKAGDRRTKWDLTVIGLLQAAFLGYALHTAWITRPVYLVWVIDHLVLVFANEIEPENLARGRSAESRTLPWTGPRRVAIALPDDVEAREKVFLSLIKEQTGIERLPKYFVPYKDARARILRDALAYDDSAGPAGQRNPKLSTVRGPKGSNKPALRLVAIESTRDASTMAIDAVTAEPFEVLPLDSLPGADAPHAEE